MLTDLDAGRPYTILLTRDSAVPVVTVPRPRFGGYIPVYDGPIMDAFLRANPEHGRALVDYNRPPVLRRALMEDSRRARGQ